MHAEPIDFRSRSDQQHELFLRLCSEIDALQHPRPPRRGSATFAGVQAELEGAEREWARWQRIQRRAMRLPGLFSAWTFFSEYELADFEVMRLRRVVRGAAAARRRRRGSAWSASASSNRASSRATAGESGTPTRSTVVCPGRRPRPTLA